jgi:chromosomal replication initiator protein
MPANSAPDIWRTALGILEIQVSSVAFETWFRGTEGHSRDKDSFTVGVPNSFVSDWLDKRMRSLIERTLSDVLKRRMEVRFAVQELGPGQSEPTTAGARSVRAADPPTEPRAARNSKGASTVSRGHDAQPPRSMGQRPNPEMTFDTFVPAPANKFAFAAATKVADRPGHSYNPLFVSGPPGLGKTHLLHAVANMTEAREETTLLVTAEQFVTDYVSSAREKRASKFEQRYRSAQVLIIDDLQFLCGKQRSEESFFNTCAVLLRESRQVVLSADRPLDHLPFTHRRLASRFEVGLEVALTPPDHDSRESILAFKATRSPVAVPDAVVRFIASRPSLSVRHMEGELAKVTALSTLTEEPLTLELATRALTPESSAIPAGLAHAPSTILHATASFYQVSPAALGGPSRERTTVHARHVAMYLLRAHTALSLQQIGRLLGNRDHTTVHHGVTKIHRLSTSDPSLGEDLVSITNAAPNHSAT